jgi:glycerophosphoryl diester phosphodiesterase
MTAATFRGAVGTTNLGNAQAPVTVPTDGTGPAVGDWMVACINFVNTGTSVTPPSGWTTLLTSQAIGSRYMAVFGKRRASGDPATYTFTLGGGAAAHSGIAYGPGGTLDPSTWQVGAFLKAATSSATQTTPGVTTAAANAYALSVQGEATSATEVDSEVVVAAPFVKRLWTLQGGSTPINSVLFADRIMGAAGATGDAVSTWKNGTGNRGSVMVVIPELVDAPAPVTHYAVRTGKADGTTAPAIAQVWTGTKLVEVSKIEYVRPGKTVSQLAAATSAKPFYVAHRLGSIDYAEGSARGATMSAILGIDALEAPVARTSDGVYFILHDSTLNRTTPSLGSTPYYPNEHTWAEISALRVSVGNAAGYGPQPYYRLDEFLATYASSHTLFIDPKLIGGAYFPELMAILKAVPDYRERIMGKYYVTGTAVADLFRNAGCKTWGYGYDDDLDNGTIARLASRWDYIGLPYGSDDDHWMRLRAIGNPIIGHIAPTKANADQATSRGAVGVMVSGVRSVLAGS